MCSDILKEKTSGIKGKIKRKTFHFNLMCKTAITTFQTPMN